MKSTIIAEEKISRITSSGVGPKQPRAHREHQRGREFDQRIFDRD